MKPPTTDACRQFAMRVVSRLHEAGFVAYWAGGCVRDQLMGHVPKDYDVATDAQPEQVRELFGRHRTLSIGQSFGVITVLGGRSVAPIEVATFREDVSYSDGRHPDAVRFSHAREDALRRDFTINGIFYDPLQDEVVDFVRGQADLETGIVRAIGDPDQRLNEDKLRMLRAVRFAAEFDFEIDPATLQAVKDHAPEIERVSSERIANELNKMLVHPRRLKALGLLKESRLWSAVFPELGTGDETQWDRLMAAFEGHKVPDFATALALIIWSFIPDQPLVVLEQVARRLRVSNHDRRSGGYILEHWQTLANAHQLLWSEVQPVLISEFGTMTLAAAEAFQDVLGHSRRGTNLCRERLEWPLDKLDPRPLVSGNDLKILGYKPGPQFRHWLDDIRAQQLLGNVRNKDEAVQWLRENHGTP